MTRKRSKGKLVVSRKTIRRTYKELAMMALDNPSLAPLLYSEIKGIVKKTRVRPPKSLKMLFCNKCGSLLPLVSRRIRRGQVVVHCRCGHVVH